MTKFDAYNYKPRNKSIPQLDAEFEIKILNMRSWYEKLGSYFSMQKTPERIFNEKKHEYEWKDGGVKSWRELFNLD